MNSNSCKRKNVLFTLYINCILIDVSPIIMPLYTSSSKAQNMNESRYIYTPSPACSRQNNNNNTPAALKKIMKNPHKGSLSTCKIARSPSARAISPSLGHRIVAALFDRRLLYIHSKATSPLIYTSSSRSDSPHTQLAVYIYICIYICKRRADVYICVYMYIRKKEARVYTERRRARGLRRRRLHTGDFNERTMRRWLYITRSTCAHLPPRATYNTLPLCGAAESFFALAGGNPVYILVCLYLYM